MQNLRSEEDAMLPWWCNKRQRRASVCAVQAMLVQKESTAWKLERLRRVYTRGESANSEPDRIPIQLRITAQKTIMTLEWQFHLLFWLCSSTQEGRKEEKKRYKHQILLPSFYIPRV